MLISDSRRLLFVHVQKTGGMSIDRMLRAHVDDLRSVGPIHSPLARILRAEPGLHDYWTFGFVRNPWARMVSWWSMIEHWYRVSGPGSGKDMTGRRLNRFWVEAGTYQGFEEFVLRGTEEHRRLRTPQIDYLTAPHRRADFVGRTETYAPDVRAVVARLGLPPIEIEQHNTSVHGHHREFYDDATRTRVAEVFAQDIDLFGYRF